MEDDMDDFGDIYADVEGYLAAGVSMIPSIRQLYLEDRAKAELSPGEVDESEDEERTLYDRIGRDAQSDGRTASAAAAAASQGSDGKPPECLGDGGDDEVAEESNESDSEDDLRIVLNEEDCKRFGAPQRVGLGNGGLLAGACTNEDEDDESAIGTGVVHPTDHKWADLSQLPEGLEQNGQERCASLKSGFVLPYSQFKYVRSQTAGCPSNAKSIGQGCVVPSSLPMASRGDWDVSGSLAAISCHIGFPVPRSRTIFDISIESFDQKPWRNQAVDITDFFNFGLNEESWKEYCDNVVLFRKQATAMARSTICEAIRTNQAFDSGFLHGATSAEASLSEVTYFERGRTALSTLEKPKGKAIQVEGGSGERLPSVDIRRPRYQDSDVVIQIPVVGSEKDASVLSKEKPEHVDNFLSHSNDGLHGGPFKTSVVHNCLTPCHDGHTNEEAADSDEKEHRESGGTILRVPEEELQSLPDSKEIFNEKQRKIDVPVLGTPSASVDEVHVLGTAAASADEVLHGSCPSSPESISKASRDDFSVDQLQSPAKRSPFGSVVGSDISVGSSSDTRHAEGVSAGANLLDLCPKGQICQSETELCGVVVEDDNDANDLDKKGQNNLHSLRRYHERLGKRSSCNHHGGEHPSSLERTKMSRSHESWRCTGKPKQLNISHTEHSRRRDFDPSSSRRRHRRHSRLERSDSMQNDVRLNENKIPRGDQNGWETEFIIPKQKYRHTILDHFPFCTRKDWNALRRSKTADDSQWCVKPDVIFEDRYRKPYIEWNDSQQSPYFDRNVVIRDEFDRIAPYRSQNKRSPQRMERYDWNLSIEMEDSQGYAEDDSEPQRYSCHRFLDGQTFRDSQYVNRRVWHESSPPRIYKHNRQRSSETDAGHCGTSDSRDARFNKQRDRDLLDPHTNDSYFSPYRDHREIGSGCCGTEERRAHPQNTLFSEGRKSSCFSQLRHVTEEKSSRLSQLRHMAEDQVSLRCQVLDTHFQEASFSCERICRHEHSSDNHKSLAGLNFLHCHSLVNGNGTRVPRKTESIAKEQNFMRHREPVSGRLNDFEGKAFGRYGEVAHKKKKMKDDIIEGFNHMDEIYWTKENPRNRLRKEESNAKVIRSTVEKLTQRDSEKCATHSNEESEEPEVSHDQDVSGLEEGQLVEPEDEDAGSITKEWDIGKRMPISSTEVKHAHDERKAENEASNSKKSVKEYDNSRILETLAKMEKRRERFKEPIPPKKEQVNNTVPQTMVVPNEVKLERPARKRRWGALKSPAS